MNANWYNETVSPKCKENEMVTENVWALITALVASPTESSGDSDSRVAHIKGFLEKEGVAFRLGSEVSESVIPMPVRTKRLKAIHWPPVAEERLEKILKNLAKREEVRIFVKDYPEVKEKVEREKLRKEIDMQTILSDKIAVLAYKIYDRSTALRDGEYYTVWATSKGMLNDEACVVFKYYYDKPSHKIA